MCLELKIEAVWLGTSSHSQSCAYVHVLTRRTHAPHHCWNLGQETALWKPSCSFRWPSEVSAALKGSGLKSYLWLISCLQWGNTQDQVMMVALLRQNKALSTLVSCFRECSTESIWKERKMGHWDKSPFSGIFLQLLVLSMEALPELQAVSELLYVVSAAGFPWNDLVSLNPLTPLDPASVSFTFNYLLCKKCF